ncbi:MAG: hypothetical protein J7M25_04630 [Deltaproteobacteria bacterium]|nr:hypothetical protein [Deltaproteobacteria bacterium]
MRHRNDWRIGLSSARPRMAGLGLCALLSCMAACSGPSHHQTDADIDGSTLQDRRPDRSLDAALDGSPLPDARPDYLMPDGGCMPDPRPVQEVEPGTLYLLPPSGDMRMKSFDLSPRYLVYSQIRCPSDSDEFYDTFLFDFQTMTERVVLYGPRNQIAGYVWEDAILYADDTLAWPPFSDDPNNKERINLWLYDITTQTATLVLDGNWGKFPHDFNGRQVLYQSTEYDPASQGVDGTDVKLYDILTGEDRLLVGHEHTVLDMAFSTKYAAWVTRSGSAWDVFYHDIEANQTIAMNRVSNYHFTVSLSERYLYWDEGTQFGGYDVWSHDFETGRDEAITAPGSDQGGAGAGLGRADHLVVFLDYSRSDARFPNYPADVVIMDRDTGVQRTLTRQPDDVGAMPPTCQWEVLNRPVGPPGQYWSYAWNLVEAGVLDDSCHVLPCDVQTEDCTTIQIPPAP